MRTVPALLAALAFAVLAVQAPPAAADDPPHAYHRLDRVAAALAKDPLFVDPDVSAALDGAGRKRVRSALRTAARRIGSPVYVVVIPNPGDSESQGRDDAFLFALHERSGRDGLYVMANARGRIESEGFRVPRDYDPFEEDALRAARPPDSERPFDGLAERVVRRLDAYAAAPSASPTLPRLYSSPDAFGEENTLTPRDPETKDPFLTGLILVGPVAAAVLYWAGLGALALHRRRGRAGGRPRAPTRPSRRWLRRKAAEELDGLRGLLAAADTGRGRTHAASAYDAAQILYDDAKDDEERAIDLVGAIVLARQGRVALAEDVASPPAPCLINPLHGGSAGRERVREANVDGVLPNPCPLCAACRDLHRRQALKQTRLLMVPGRDGARRHTAVPGVWRDAAWGARGKDFLPRVMRYLGVD